MPYGHASHQVGLDADIWLELSPKPALTVAAREDIVVPSLVLPDESGIDPRAAAAPCALIRLAAEMPGVDRVFVNHAIKRELCRTIPAPPGCAGYGPGAAMTAICISACAARPASRTAGTSPHRRPAMAAMPHWTGG